MISIHVCNRRRWEEIKLGKKKEIREDIKEGEGRGELSTCTDGMTVFACTLR